MSAPLFLGSLAGVVKAMVLEMITTPLNVIDSLDPIPG
jgi:hypothetical protein